MINNAEFELLNPDAQIDLLSKYLYLEINQVPVRQGTPLQREIYGEIIPFIWSSTFTDINYHFSKFVTQFCDNLEDVDCWTEDEVYGLLYFPILEFLLSCFNKKYFSFEYKQHWLDLGSHSPIECVFHI